MQNNERQILIGDEVKFSLNGRVNSQNVREYAENGHPPVDFNADIRDALHCWCGLTSAGHLIGERFFEANLNGRMYVDMLNEYVLPECGRLGVELDNIWWFQDGCPAHRMLAVRERLQELFPGRVVALGHPVEFPSRSHDLTPGAEQNLILGFQ